MPGTVGRDRRSVDPLSWCVCQQALSRLSLLFGRYWSQIWHPESLPDRHLAGSSTQTTIGSW